MVQSVRDVDVRRVTDTKEDIDTVLQACDEIGDVLDLKHLPGERWPLKKIMDNAVELVNSAAE